jgi:hypothetical protein
MFCDLHTLFFNVNISGSLLMVKRQNQIARKNGQLERNQTTTSAPYQMKNGKQQFNGKFVYATFIINFG